MNTAEHVLRETVRRTNERQIPEVAPDARDWCARDCRWYTVARHLAGQIVEYENAPDVARPGWAEESHRVLGQQGLLREAEMAADLLEEARKDHGRNR